MAVGAWAAAFAAMQAAVATGQGASWQPPALVLVAFVQWLAVARLALWRVERRDLKWIIPSIALALMAGNAGERSPAALLAIPALVRSRWRYELRGRERALLGLLAILFLASHFLGVNDIRAPLPDPQLGGAHRFARWVDGLGVIYALLGLGHVRRAQLRIRSIKRRLVVSHLMAGAVPVLLLLAFWFLSAYITMCSDKAATAARLMQQDAADLRTALESGLAAEDPARALAPLGATVLRPPADAQPWLAHWTDDLPQAGVAWIEGEAYLAARVAPDVALRPLEPLMTSRYEAAVEARVALGTNLSVTTDESGVRIGPDVKAPGDKPAPILTLSSGDEAAPGFDDPQGRRRVGADIGGGPGAAGLPLLEFSAAGGRLSDTLVLARAGFVESLIGSVRSVRESPVNIFYLVILGLVALLFLVLELYTVGMVTRMGRSIAKAIAALRRGTAALEEGRLEHRIPIEDRDDLWEVAAAFNQMAKGLQRAQALELERERMEGELRLARQIQSRLLPAGPPAVPGLDLAGTYLPAQEVGGDYYGYLPAGEGRVGLVIADVAGKGIPAALLMSGFRASLVSQPLDALEPGEVLARVNEFLLRGIDPGRFVTAFLAVIEPAAGRLRYAGAGHNPPLLLRASGAQGRDARASVERLEAGGIMLGVLDGLAYPTAEVTLEPGDLLVLYTDGVTEAQNDAGDQWGEERFVEALRRAGAAGGVSCARLTETLVEEVRSFEGPHQRSDDVTLVLARYVGAAVVVR